MKWKEIGIISKRVLCLSLSFSLLIPTMSNSKVNHLKAAQLNLVEDSKISNNAIKGKDEILDLRTEKSKTFLNANGTYTTQISQSPLHFKDRKSNSWEDINNNLLENSTQLFNDKHSFKVIFNKKYSVTENLLNITEDEYNIGVIPISSTNEMTVNNGLHWDGNQITYNNIFQGSSLKYEISNDRVKEDIVILKKPEKSVPLTYSFQLKLKGLDYQQRDDGSITLIDSVTKKVVYTIARPFMYDSFSPVGFEKNPSANAYPEEALSYDVHYEVEMQDSKIIIKVIPDQTWLNDKNRVYPVTIDPTIIKFQPTYALADTNIRSAFPNTNAPTDTTLGVGLYQDASQTNVIRSLLKFDTSSIPVGSKVFSADLNLWLGAVSNNTNITASLHEVTSPWSEYSATWNYADAGVLWSNKGGDYLSSAISSVDGIGPLTDLSINYQWAIPSAILEKWINDPLKNKGFLLKSTTENSNTYKKFISGDDTGNVAYSPALSITYYPASRLGVEDFWSYDQHPLLGGESSTNLGTGNNIIQFTDYLLEGRGNFGIEFTRTYNSKAVDKSPLGFGWSYPGSETIINSVRDGNVLYTDADGTAHIFQLDSSSGSYKSPPGKYLTLRVLKSGSAITGYEIIDKYGIVSHFDKIAVDSTSSVIKARISYIQDLHGNKSQFIYDLSGKLTNIIDAAGKQIILVYDVNNRVDYATYTGLKTDYSYDSEGKLTAVDQYKFDGSFSRTQFIYNQDKRITTIIDSDGRKTDYTYNEELLMKVQEPKDDAAGNDLQNRPGTRYSFDFTNKTASVTDPIGYTTTSYLNDNNVRVGLVENGESTSYKLDGNYNQLEIRDSNGGVSYNTYDDRGNLLTHKDTSGNITTYAYDQFSHGISQTSGGTSNLFEYNVRGDMIRMTDENNESTVYSYDSYGNLQSTQYPDNSIESYGIDSDNNNVRTYKDMYGYISKEVTDVFGNVISRTDGRNYVTKYEYYPYSNKLYKVTDPNNNTTVIEYNSFDNISKITDSKNNSVKYEYQNNRLTREIDQATHTHVFEYDSNGNNTGSRTPNGNVITNNYDNENKLKSTAINGGLEWEYGYAPNGLLESVITKGLQTKFVEYNDSDLLQKENDRGNVKEYFYTNNSLIEKLRYNVGSVTGIISFEYTDDDQLEKISKNGTLLVDFDYNKAGLLDYANKENGMYTDPVYDKGNRLIEYANYNPNGSSLNKYVYTYDGNGNITKVESNTGSLSYEYDSKDQLSKEVLEDGTTIAYDYDSVGNLINKTVKSGDSSIVTSYEINSINQIASKNGQLYQYDNDGNLREDGSHKYIYNELDQLIEVHDSNNVVIFKAKYDDAGRRIQTETLAGITNYFYEGYNVIYETNSSNEIIAEYTWDPQGHPVTMTRNGQIYYYQLNGHGDVVSLTDKTGNIVATYKYDAWGNILFHAGEMDKINPYRYASYRYDEPTNLYYLNSRYYNSTDGRFIIKDNYGGQISNTQTLNLYSYVGNNPLSHTDPTGHSYTWMLNLISKGYNNGSYNKYDASIMVLGANVLNFVLPAGNHKGTPGNFSDLYIPFHEIAQINVAKALYKKYKKHAELEKTLPTGKRKWFGLKKVNYYADIVLGKKVWEVKPRNGKDPVPQLELYKKIGGLSLGEKLSTISDIPVFDGVKMRIEIPGDGKVFYSLYWIRDDGKLIELTTVGAAIAVARALAKLHPAGRRLAPAF